MCLQGKALKRKILSVGNGGKGCNAIWEGTLFCGIFILLKILYRVIAVILYDK